MVIVAARLTEKQKQKITADYVEIGSYNAVAKINGVALNTVKKIVQENAEIATLYDKKKEEVRADILAHMETRKDKVCDIIDLYLDELLDIRQFRNLTPSQLTTALGTLIDKFTASGRGKDDQDKGVTVIVDV